eukprot:Ihof_evm1s499 gene=Ihof_evmTU1s499
MKYQSTRGESNGLSFEQAVMTGLAPDGGLYVPENIPSVSEETMNEWSKLSFAELATEVLSLYIGDEIPRKDLEDLTRLSYETFSDDLTTPVKKLSDSLYILELFHGPTFAFKDVALQFLGNLFEYFLERTQKKTGVITPITVLGATSGDTGSAAIQGLRGKRNIDVFILHPEGRVAPVQERQMTTVLDNNVHNIAVEGSFDDCQAMVKECFRDTPFNANYHLAAINSINWARILAQIVYYFHAYFQYRNLAAVGGDFPPIMFSVPTGNFGDCLAGYYAKQMGLPILKEIVATNNNDILHRFMQTGKMECKTVMETLAPAMDIQISSNFERYLYYLFDKDSKELKVWMDLFSCLDRLTINEDFLKKAQKDFWSHRSTDEEIISIISKYYKDHNYVLCPHSACGVAAVDEFVKEGASALGYHGPIISLATAHPAKFGDAVKKAIGKEPEYPQALEDVKTMPTRCLKAPNDRKAIKQLVRDHSSIKNCPNFDGEKT